MLGPTFPLTVVVVDGDAPRRLRLAADLGERAGLFRACLARPLDRKMLEAALEGLGASVS